MIPKFRAEEHAVSVWPEGRSLTQVLSQGKDDLSERLKDARNFSVEGVTKKDGSFRPWNVKLIRVERFKKTEEGVCLNELSGLDAEINPNSGLLVFYHVDVFNHSQPIVVTESGLYGPFPEGESVAHEIYFLDARVLGTAQYPLTPKRGELRDFSSLLYGSRLVIEVDPTTRKMDYKQVHSVDILKPEHLEWYMLRVNARLGAVLKHMQGES